MFDGEQPAQDLMAMGGEAAAMTMENRHIVELEQRLSSKERAEYHEMRQRPMSKETDFDLLPRALWLCYDWKI